MPHAALRAGLIVAMRRGRGALIAGLLAVPALSVSSPPVPYRPLPDSVSGLGNREIRAQLTPLRYTTLAAEIGAKISRLPIPESGRFRAGQALIQFDCSVQHAQLNKAQAALSAAEKLWRANQRLAELKSIGTLQVVASEAEVLKARAEVAANQAILGKCSVVAPYGGRVAEQKVREQQYVQPGQPLLEILDDSALVLEFIVPSRWLSWIQPQQPFLVQIDETGRSYPAKVTRIAARVDPVSQSVELTGVIDGSFRELISGMSGRVQIAPPAGQ